MSRKCETNVMQSIKTFTIISETKLTWATAFCISITKRIDSLNSSTQSRTCGSIYLECWAVCVASRLVAALSVSSKCFTIVLADLVQDAYTAINGRIANRRRMHLQQAHLLLFPFTLKNLNTLVEHRSTRT